MKALIWIKTKRLRDAQGIWCVECEQLLDDLYSNPFWSISKTKGLHEGGTGHTVNYVRLEDDNVHTSK